MIDHRRTYERQRAIHKYNSVIEDPLFQAAVKAAAGRSLLVPEKLQHLFLLIRDELAGLASQNIVEFGSYSGGSALMMAFALKQLHPQATLYALDTFAGMPETDPLLDLHRAGAFSNADLVGFRARAAELELDNLIIVPGLIQETFPKIADHAFGLAHVDVDIYSAVKYAQDAVWPALVDDGWLVYDDANAPTCLGAKRAAEELVIEKGIHSEQVWPHWVFRRTRRSGS